MRSGEYTGLAVATAGVIMLAGCAPEAQDPVPEPSASVEQGPIGPVAPEAAPQTMDIQYINTEGASPELAQLQVKIGDASIEAALLEPFTVMVDGVEQTIQLSVPQGAEEQSQAIVFIANSEDAGEIFTQYGLPDTDTNTTFYQLDYGPNGELVRSGPSMSVVGQEMTNAGPFRSIATERCQPLEMINPTQPITDQSVYDGIKEAVCNTLGYAADSIMLDIAYPEYVQTYGGVELGSDVNSGHSIEYPTLSETQYNHLVTKLGEINQ